jgi:site-specific DNA recombinase
MIAAIYARKSTDQSGVGEDEKSVTRQIDRAKNYAAQKGWDVSSEHIFMDDGISGAEFERRPGLVRLLAQIAQKPRPPFGVLIISEKSRLGREATETGYVVKKILRAGVRIFSYLDQREISFESPIDKLVENVLSIADELEREKARTRTKDALTRKAEAGHVPGGQTFGYSNVRVNSHAEYQINESEATIIRRIFELAAEGRGTRWIAKRLNDDHVLAPVPRRAGRPRAWAPSTVYAMLTRPLYRGDIVWNRTRKRDSWGIKKQAARPKEEWVRLDAPQLRIVPEALWQAVQSRLKTSRASYLRASNGQLWGRPGNAIESKYLLTGLAQCGICGGGLIAHSRASRPHRKYAYICSYYHLRGTTVCPTGVLLPMEETNHAVLETFERKVLHPDVVAVGLRHGLELLKPTEDSLVPRREALQAELAVLEQELARFTAAVAQGGDLPALVEAIKSREQRRLRLREELAGLDGLQRLASIDLGQIQRELQARLAEWQELMNRQVPVARQIVKKLLTGRIVFRRTEDGGYEFSGHANPGRIIAGLACTKAVVAPTGFEPVFQP